jgi:uncharacterized repeat protein (TIGR03803 family)
LHFFAGGPSDGGNPAGNLIMGKDGNFYGMTSEGGTTGGNTYALGPIAGSGTIFKCTTSGTETILYNFMGAPSDGASPNGSLIQDTDGSFYGMTCYGGAGGSGMGLGTIFKFSPTGTETVLHSFAGGASDGKYPYGSLVQGSDGSLYGMTSAGGESNYGTIFRCTKTGTITILYSFSGIPPDGASPYGSLIQGNDGNLYGMTSAGGVSGYGTIFECTMSGSLTVLQSLTGANGGTPYGDLLEVENFSVGTPYIGKTIVYPNPNNGVFTIQSSAVSGQSSVEVYNMLGEKVYSNYQITKLSNYQINLSNQSNGVYLYRVLNENGSLLGAGKLIIQK